MPQNFKLISEVKTPSYSLVTRLLCSYFLVNVVNDSTDSRHIATHAAHFTESHKQDHTRRFWRSDENQVLNYERNLWKAKADKKLFSSGKHASVKVMLEKFMNSDYLIT